MQKVLRQAREVQGTPAIRQTVKPAKTKFDTYVVQNKVRLRKDTPVPAKEERKVVGLAKKIEWEAGKRQFKQSVDGKLSPAINGPLYSGKALSDYGYQALNSIGSNNLQYTPNLNSSQNQGVVEQLKQLFIRPVDRPDPHISKQDLPAWAINICNNKTAILRKAAQGHQEEIKAETKRLIQVGLTGEKLADAVMNYIINFVPLEIADVGTLPDYVIPWLLQEPMVSISGLTSSSNRNITITNRAILHAMRSTKVNGGRAANVGDFNHLTKIIEQGNYVYDKEHNNIIAFLPYRNLYSPVTAGDEKKVIKLPIHIRANQENSIPTIGKVFKINVIEGKDRNKSQYLTIKKPTP